MHKYLIITLLILAGLSHSCEIRQGASNKQVKVDNSSVDLEDLRAMGKIRVITDYNSTNYFVYKGRPMGYQFELLKSLSNYLGLKLEMVVSNDVEENFVKLLAGEADLIAMNLAITRNRSSRIAFSEPHCVTRQVLVQRVYSKENKLVSKDSSKVFNELIRNQLELAGKSIYVQENSSFADRLRTLSNEIGDSINVIEIPDYEVEQLIGLVAHGEIPYTVCDENLALVNLNYYDNIDVETAISFPQKIAWAMRPESKSLQAIVNNWLIGFKKTGKYRQIYQKYFLNKRSTHIVDEGFHSIKGGQVSVFDELIKKESKRNNLDWRLIASLIYQESRFLPEVESWAGAVGLMQLMPETAKAFGVKRITSPTENVRGGIKFLIWLDKRFKDEITDPEERVKFVLASYNVGLGHVQDAMRLAEKNGKNPKIWHDHVDYYLLNKSNPEFFMDPVVKYGYCRGEEPYHYVIDILERYDHYKNVILD